MTKQKINSWFELVKSVAVEKFKADETDFLQNGLWYCGYCHTPRQYDMGDGAIVPVQCQCRAEKYNAERQAWEKTQREIRQSQLRHGNVAKGYRDYTFRTDDRRNPHYSDLFFNFAQNFDKVKSGFLLTGGVGNGKTFYACCVANYLLERNIPVAVTSFPTLLMNLQDDSIRHKVIPNLCCKRLVVLDDLGAERDTSFAKELLFSVIDSLATSGTIVIITSNLSKRELERPENMDYKRIYDRITGKLCVEHIPFVGESRRQESVVHQRQELREALGR